MKNFFVHPALARRDLELVGWTVRGLDTVSRDPEKVAARVLRGLNPARSSSSMRATGPRATPIHPRCLRATLRGLTNLEYRCVLPKPEQRRPRVVQKQISDC